MFFRKKNLDRPTIHEQVIVVWGPGGNNTAKFSWKLANQLSTYTTVALVELPCLGIPRLGVEADILDRTNHTDTAILEYDRKISSPLNYCHKITENLAILPANPRALPDHPVVQKITSLDSLQSFPNHFINEARKQGFRIVILDCQGSLVSPMTFFSLQTAEKIVLIVDDPADISWSLLNKERLVNAYQINPEIFYAATTSNNVYHEEIKQVLGCTVITPENLITPFQVHFKESRQHGITQKQVIAK